MANLSRNFLGGKMNKVTDERLVPQGEYIDALNIRMGSTEKSEVGVIENAKGNLPLTTLRYVDGTALSNSAVCIGAVDDSANNVLYWFVHDPNFASSTTGKLDLIASYDVDSNILTYHVISTDDGGGVDTTLNFNPKYLISSINKIDDLIFFTDNYNAPRFINVKRNYPNPIAYIDQFSAESILVIKKPPIAAPSINPYTTVGQENFLDTRFISFAYRYRYADGEYSATSQWSAPSFIPKPFKLSTESYLNDGMTNLHNACEVTYNSGGPLVVGIDLLFKQNDSNIIKVIEKINKSVLGISDNTNYTYQFINSKIFTVLPESELLRLYDNVPRYAEAQTIMGNRLMYSNYIEGYDLIGANGSPLLFDYYTELISEDISTSSLHDDINSSDYNINGFITVSNSAVSIDLSSVNLVKGASLSLDVTINHSQFSGDMPYPTETTGDVTVSFSFYLPQDYSSVYQMATSAEFQNAVGTVLNIKPVFDATPGAMTSCDGNTFTDFVNCIIPNNLDTLTKFASGVSADGQPITIITSPSSNEIGFQFIAMRYVNNTSTPTQNVYEYYEVSYANAIYQEIGTANSLHSNRDYEVGIVYMDEFNRATTALVSLNNTEHVPCGYSSKKNHIRVTIPPSQVAPSWAKRYKFVMKPDAEGYETIYSNIFFNDPSTNEVWFLLQGENTKKVEVGDRYIVKSDTSGPLTTCVYTTVLAKETKASGALGSSSPAGVYMKVNPNNFSAVQNPDAVFTVSNSVEQTNSWACAQLSLDFTKSGNNVTIPAGSVITIDFFFLRKGTGNACEERRYYFAQQFVATADYQNFKEWWDMTNMASTIDTGYKNPAGGIFNVYNSSFLTGPFSSCALVTNYYQFQNLGPTITGDAVRLWMSGTETCSGWGDNRHSTIAATVIIYRATNLFVFETIPTDANPDIFYENDECFDIGFNGEHLGNVQDQDFILGTPAIIDIGFFNCFAFGNGVESYKIRDSLIGNQFSLGNRVTSVSAQDYKEAHRYSDITYSGIYNNESNVNKLNEFNLGLINFKKLETSFGPVFKIDGRETDVLVLQEDKVSYVLAGKNLLSDAAAGGAITSVPEVLGTQIARVEKYGISMNPESYVHWGQNRFFTDAKRGAVIQIAGNSYQSDQLRVISEMGMRTWFRDNFIDYFNTQKLGGYDPYLNEYVLSSNDRELPGNVQCLDCGISQTFNISTEGDTITYCVNLGQAVGVSTVTWVVNYAAGAPLDSFTLDANYNGDPYTSGPTTTSGSFIINKDSNTVETVDMTLNIVGTFNISITVGCPESKELTIFEIVLTDDVNSGQSIHTEYRYYATPYTSPLQSNYVTFASGVSNPLVSRYNSVSGYVGSSGFPTTGSIMRMRTNKMSPTDTFDFNPLTNKFKYLMSDDHYSNTSVDINTLLSLATNAYPTSGSSPIYYSDFTVPSIKKYLYLVWDLRESNQNLLCYNSDSSNDVCCNCDACTSECVTVTISNPSEQNFAAVILNSGFCGEGIPAQLALEPAESVNICVVNSLNMFTPSFGNPIISIDNCECTATPCYYYFVINSNTTGVPNNTDFTGWTIDGNDFYTNYVSAITSYGWNVGEPSDLFARGSVPFPFVETGEGIVVWKVSYAPPTFPGAIYDASYNYYEAAISSAICTPACWKLSYVYDTAYSNLITYFEYLGLIYVTPLSYSLGKVDCVSTFGHELDMANPSDVNALQVYLQSIYGASVTVSSVFNGTSYDIYINNVYDFGTWTFYSNTSPSVTRGRWFGEIAPCGT